ncbi:6-phosphofructokinase [Lonepinella sp. BR2271]|uniref:6-phosphofructokinase n=1 Tax=Lonepinella sp. BR2271 TaxID=3434550 RepID=UPI003F6DDB92
MKKLLTILERMVRGFAHATSGVQNAYRNVVTALLAVLWLSGCVTQQPTEPTPQVQLNVPQNITYHHKNYALKSSQDLGSMAHYVYFMKKENGKNWKTAIELLHDRNVQNVSLQERIQLRENVYKTNGVEHFNFTVENGTMYAFVIYAPNEQQPNWQLEVARASDVAGCGFVQYQYSLKVPQSRKLANMGKEKLVGYLKKYAIDKELARLHQLTWHWHCELPQISSVQK